MNKGVGGNSMTSAFHMVEEDSMCKGPKVGLGGVGLESKLDQETWAAPGSQHRVVGERAWERPQEQSWHVPQHPPPQASGPGPHG